MSSNQKDINENSDSQISEFGNDINTFRNSNFPTNSTNFEDSRHNQNLSAPFSEASRASSNQNLSSISSTRLEFPSTNSKSKFSNKKKGRQPIPKEERQYSSSIPIAGTRIRSRSSNLADAAARSRSNHNSDNENDPRAQPSYEEDENEDPNIQQTATIFDRGLPIERIYCRSKVSLPPLDDTTNFDMTEAQYLVKLEDEAPYRSVLVVERSMKYGSYLPRLLAEFQKSYDSHQLKISSIGLDYYEPNARNRIVDMKTFEIEQIIGHRSFEPETKYMEKLLDQSNHIPGLPTDIFLPTFEEMPKFQSRFYSPDEAYSLMRDDGFYSIDETTRNSVVLHDESELIQRKIEINTKEVNDENDSGVPLKVEFKIQWKNLPASQCTWESEDTLHNLSTKQTPMNFVVRRDLFCPTNVNDFESLVNKYWQRTVKMSEKNITLSSEITKNEVIHIDKVPDVIPSMERSTILFDIQEDIIKQLFLQKMHHINHQSSGLCQVIRIANTGRIFALVSFLQMLYTVYHATKPSMIIVDDENSYLWKDALKTISSLYWFEFSGTSSNLSVLKHYRFDGKTRFDVLITNHTILKREDEFLSAYDWDTIIIDDIHSSIEKHQVIEAESIAQRNRQKKSGKSFDDDRETDEVFDFDSISSVVFKTNLFKQKSPFMVLLNDDIAIPRFNQMNLEYKVNMTSEINDQIQKDGPPVFTPFHFTEAILLVPNLISELLFKKLSVLFKKRPARVLNMPKALDIVNECILIMQHPSVIPSIHREAFNLFKERIGFTPSQLPRIEKKRKEILKKMELDFLRSSCGKFSALDQLILGPNNDYLTISAIVAEDLAILKLLRSYLMMLDVPVGIINTNVPEEKVPDDFTHGVLLMSRDISYEQIDNFTIKQIIFYDVSTTYKHDMNFIQFISRPRLVDGEMIFPDIDVYRILTRHSIEIELFMKTTMNSNEDGVLSSFNYKQNLSIRNAETILRALVLQTRDAEDERNEVFNKSSDLYQFHGQPSPEAMQKFNSISSFQFEFPGNESQLKETLSSILDEIDSDDFWSEAFTSKHQPEPELTSIDYMKYVYTPSNDTESDSNQEKDQALEYRIYIELMKHGVYNWELIANIVGMPVADVQKIGKGMILKMLSNIELNEIHLYTLASNIYWFEYSDTFANGHQLDEPDIWRHMITSRKAHFQASIYKKDCFVVKSGQQMPSEEKTTVLDSPFAERNLRLLEENYVIRVFLAFRKSPYLPPRFFAKKGSAMHSPEFIYDFLNFYANNTGDWAAVKRKFNLTQYTTEAVITYFTELYDAIFNDLYSFIIHQIYSGGREKLIEKDLIIRPFLQVLEQGPFILNWYEDEVNRLTDILISYSVPLTSEGNEDWCEFHSLTRLLTKTTENIEFMTSFIMEGIKPLTEYQKFTILPDITMGNPITVLQKTVKKLKNRLAFLPIIQKLACGSKLDHFRPQVELPEGWTVDHDSILLKGICQFGYGKLLELGKVDINFYEHEDMNCPIMTEDLSQFASFISDKQSISKRLKLILISNADIDPTLSKRFDDIFGDTSNTTTQIKKGRAPQHKKAPPPPRAIKPPPTPTSLPKEEVTNHHKTSDTVVNDDLKPKPKPVKPKPKKSEQPKKEKPKIEYVYDNAFLDDDAEENDNNDDDDFHEAFSDNEEDLQYVSKTMNTRSYDIDVLPPRRRSKPSEREDDSDSDDDDETYNRTPKKKKDIRKKIQNERIREDPIPIPNQHQKITFVYHPVPQKIIFKSG